MTNQEAREEIEECLDQIEERWLDIIATAQHLTDENERDFVKGSAYIALRAHTEHVLMMREQRQHIDKNRQ